VVHECGACAVRLAQGSPVRRAQSDAGRVSFKRDDQIATSGWTGPIVLKCPKTLMRFLDPLRHAAGARTQRPVPDLTDRPRMQLLSGPKNVWLLFGRSLGPSPRGHLRCRLRVCSQLGDSDLILLPFLAADEPYYWCQHAALLSSADGGTGV
jgi:hypothetical protein